jgi:hypothetical protein
MAARIGRQFPGAISTHEKTIFSRREIIYSCWETVY